MIDAGVTGLLVCLALVAGVLIGAGGVYQLMGGSNGASEVDRRTAPPGPPTIGEVDVE